MLVGPFSALGCGLVEGSAGEEDRQDGMAGRVLEQMILKKLFLG